MKTQALHWYNISPWICGMIFPMILCSGCLSTDQPTLTIAVAANSQFAIEAITESFELESGIACQLVVGSSGKLTAQIRAGAPFDLFISANTTYPETLEQEGLSAAPTKIFAKGQLVLWSLVDQDFCQLDQLTSAQIQHIAMANPALAPYGKAAQEALQNMNLEDQVRSKLVYGESIAQTNQFIVTKAAEVGFTAKSVTIAKPLGHYQSIDPSLYQPIEQGCIVMKASEYPKQAQRFFTYLSSESAKVILRHHGYEVD